MKKDDLQEILADINEQEMSRRDAMKLMAVSPLAASGMIAASGTATEAEASDAKGKIVIVGGGLVGMATAARLTNSLSNPDITIIEPDPRSVSYQPGLTLIGSGVWESDDIVYERDEFLPSGATLIAEKAVEFDPENNTVKTDSGKSVSYDYLIISTGLKLNYGAIKGLKGEITSMQKNPTEVNEVLGKNGVHSIYYADGAANTWKGIEELIAKAKSHTGEEKLQAFFTHPNTPIKCGGAPKKIMYLTDARLREAGVRDKVELTFMPNGGKMFGVQEYHDAIVKQYEARDMKWMYKHNLVEIDPENQIAIFETRWEEKGEYDEDLEEYDIITKTKRVEKKFDFIHITPPMKAPDEVGNSPLGSGKGWIPVDFQTLQHKKFDNVFSLGDVAAVPLGKTGGTARKQYKVVVDNLIAKMEGKEKLEAKFDGYTVCPLITSLGTVMLAEFNFKDPANGEFGGKMAPSFPLDATQERWIWWLLKVYLLKPMTVYGMLSGRA
jgi:sulfide:quinone oxidoreductase